MVAVKAFWIGLPDVVRYVITLATGAGSAVVVVGMALNIPARLTATEHANERQDAEIVQLQSVASRAEYLFCVDLADRRLTPRTPQGCFQEYVNRGPQ